MIGKNNQKLKNKKEGVKIESYSIKKFKVGAASVVIGASIFFGAAGIANAGEVSGEKTEKNIAGEKANSSNDEKTDVLNNKISTEKEVKKPIKKEEVSTDATPAEKTNANADKKVEKKALDKNTLKTNIEKVEELLEKINKEKASASTLAAIKIDLENAKNILNSTSAELTQAEIDALAKKLSEKIFVLSSMPKANTPEKVVKEGENTIANTGSRDSRNRQSIGEGTHFRADGQVSSGALANIKYFASVDPNDNGGRRTRNNEPEFTKNKTDIKAYYVQDSEGKWIVYDVFFNNDGRKMTGSSYQQHYYFQAPFNIMDPSNTVKDLTFTRYRNTGGRRLSDGFQGFEQYGNTATITNPWSQQYRIFNADRDTFYDPNSGVNRDNQRWDVFKNNQYDPTLNQLPKDKNGNYPRASYHLGLDVRRESTDYAVHMHAKIKLKNDITEAEANAYGRAYAASVTKASGTNQSYIMGTLGTSLTPRDTTPPTITANNATVTSREQITPISVTAEDNRGGVGMRDNNPIEVSGLPSGLTYANNRITGTPTGAPGNSTVTIKAYDKNGNMATKTITITVRSQADTHNPTGAGLTVNQGQVISDDAVKAKVSNYAPGTLSIVSKPSTATAGNAGNAVVKVTYPDGTFDNVNVPVTVTDVTGPTITANNATVTSREQITPIPVTAVDNTGGVGMRQNNPIEVTGLPAGLTYSNGRITGTPTGPAGNSTVTIKAYDRNNTPTTKTITITVRSQADVHNPTGSGLTVNQNHTITDAELKAKVSNFAPGTLSIVSKPSTTRAGSAGNAVVKVTYPDGTFDNVNVPVTITDVTGPTIKANGATVTNREPIPEIPVTAVDNTGGVGMRDNNPIVVTDLPAGLTFTNGKITGTPTGTAGTKRVTITAYDKNNTPTTKVIEIVVQEQKVKYNPTGETLTVPYNHKITDDEVKVKVQNFGPGTLTVQSKPSTNTSGNVGNAVVIVTYPDGSTETVDVPVVVGRPNKDDYTPKYNDGSGKPGESVRIPVSEANGKTIPAGTTYTSLTPGVVTVDGKGKVTVTIPADKNPGDKVTGKVLVRYPDGSEEEVPVTVTVVNRDKDDYTPKYNDGSGKPGESVGIPVSEANGKTIPAGTTYTSLTPGVVTVDDKGKVTVTIPADKNPGDKVTGKVLVRYPDGSEEEVPVTVTVTDKDKDIYTPKYEDGNGKPGTKVEIPLKEENGKEIPTGTTYESDQPGVITVDDKGKVTVTIPGDKKPGDKITGKITVTYPDGSKEEVPVTVTVGEQDKDIYTPKYDEGKGKPGSKVEIPLTEENGKKIPTGTTFESDKPGIITVDKDGKVTVTIPEGAKPGDKITGKVLVKYPDGSIEEVPVTVTVGEQDKDIYTPKYDEGKGKPGSKVEIPLTEENGKKIPSGTTFESDKPGIITVDKDGKVTVTIPEGAKPGDKVTGKVTVTYPDGSKEDVPVNVTVTTPAKLTPTVELEQNPNTGDVTVTPKKPDGSTYPPGTKVEIPGKNGNTITVTIGEDGKGTVPNSDLPDRKVPGVARITEPGKPTVEVPVVTTPAKLTPTVELEQDPKTGDVTVTPKKPDGSTYPPGTKVEIPGKNGTPIVVIIGQDGKGTVPNNDLPEGKVPGVAKITEPGKPTVEVPVVTTPAKLTPTVELEQNPNTGDVTVTPKKPDGSIYPPGTKVEIPGKDGNTITVTIGEDGKGTVPNNDLPEGKVPGVAKITEPGKPTVEVPVVTTPAKLTPTVELEQDPKTGDVTVTPKKSDGSTYPPGTKVEIPGKNGTPIVVIIGQDGKGTVPNSDLPDRKVPGVARITEPGKPTVEVPMVTTPAKIKSSEKGKLQSQKLSDNKENPIANKSTKRLANTGESETNTGLAGLGLAMLGSLLAVAKKRREDKE